MTALASVCPVGGLVELGGLLADLLADLGGEEADEGRLLVGVIVDVVVDRDHRDVGCGGLLEHGRADLLVGDDGDDAVDARADRLIHGIHRQRGVQLDVLDRQVDALLLGHLRDPGRLGDEPGVVTHLHDVGHVELLVRRSRLGRSGRRGPVAALTALYRVGVVVRVDHHALDDGVFGQGGAVGEVVVHDLHGLLAVEGGVDVDGGLEAGGLGLVPLVAAPCGRPGRRR